MALSDRIIEILQEFGIDYKEKARTIYTRCPRCGRDDKFSILKENGAAICYRGSCDFGKAWFENWIMETANMPFAEAKKLLHGDQTDRKLAEAVAKPDTAFSFLSKGWEDDEEKIEEDVMSGIKPIEWPEWHMIRAISAMDDSGMNYLAGRGVSKEMAERYGIHYSASQRRVIFPIVMNGMVYGWQGRHIDKVDDNFRMRNNVGFRREVLVMFADNLKNSEHAIICEGPFDAMKFDKVGGYVASMGKYVSNKQLAIIMSYGVKKIYLALDEDAAAEMRDIHARSPVPTFLIQVPESCVKRCEERGVKADFGECTEDECVQAFKNAIDLSSGYMITNLKFS